MNWWNIVWGLWAFYVVWRVRLLNMNQTIIIENQKAIGRMITEVEK